MQPEISLITATLGRVVEVRILLDSLVNQTYKNFELIIVDQNEHFLLKDLISEYENKINISYIRSDIKGLSINRNIGLKYAKGKILGFPDDDCFYSENILKNAVEILGTQKYKVVCFNVFDVSDKNFCWKPVTKGVFYRNKLFTNCISFNFFIQKNDVLFDEQLGVGARFGSGEETDYLFENINKSDICYGDEREKIYHIFSNFVWNEEMIKKNYRYCEGFGAICKKDIFIRHSFSTIFLYLKFIIRPLIGLIIKSNKKVYATSLQGRIKGFFCYKLK